MSYFDGLFGMAWQSWMDYISWAWDGHKNDLAWFDAEFMPDDESFVAFVSLGW